MKPFDQVAQIVVVIDSDPQFEEDLSAKRLLSLLRENEQDLLAELSIAFESLRGILLPGKLEIREGSVQVVLGVLGNIAEWTAVAAGVWQMLEYLRREIEGRVKRFLLRTLGVNSTYVSSVVVPKAKLSSVAIGFPVEKGWPNLLHWYLLACNALLLLWVLAISLVLLIHVL